LLIKHLNCGHEYESKWDYFKQGRRCPLCNGSIKHSYEFVKCQIEKTGYTLVSTEYVNAHTKLLIQCDKGHYLEMIYNNFQQGKRCPECNVLNQKEKLKLNINDIKMQIESVKGYKLLSNEYENAYSKLKIQCPKNHRFKMSYKSFYYNESRCPECNKENVTSKSEIEIQEYVKTLTENVICNDRAQILNPLTGRYLELDVYLPNSKKAIEYNGEY